MDAKINSSFWADAGVENLPPQQKLALLWLMTNSSRDLLGFVSVTARRFIFETGLDSLHPLQGACEALPRSFQVIPTPTRPPSIHLRSPLQAPSIPLASPFEDPHGVTIFITNFLRHQFGAGGNISLQNKVIVSAIKRAATLPTPPQQLFVEAYPELREAISDAIHEAQTRPERKAASKGLPSPSEGVIAEQQQHIESSPGDNDSESSQAERTNAELAEMLCSIHPKHALTGPALAAAAQALKRHQFEDILAGTTRYAEAVATWTEAERIQFVTNPERFFSEDTWRQPAENWKSRKGINGTQKKTMTVAEMKDAMGGRAHDIDFSEYE
jgi:hypothetical protein